MHNILFIESGNWITGPSQVKVMWHFGVVTTSSSGWSLAGAHLAPVIPFHQVVCCMHQCLSQKKYVYWCYLCNYASQSENYAGELERVSSKKYFVWHRF